MSTAATPQGSAPRVGRVRWTSAGPTEIDEQLNLYADGTALLTIRTARDQTPVIGTFAATIAAADRQILDGVDLELDIRHAFRLESDPAADDPTLLAADRVAAAARQNPIATATFHAGALAGGQAALLAVGGGQSPAEFELAADSGIVHVIHNGAQTSWQQAGRIESGFVSPEPAGLGGIGRPAEILPAAYGVIALAGPPIENPAGVYVEIAVEVRGTLIDALPTPEIRPFRVRTSPVVAIP